MSRLCLQVYMPASDKLSLSYLCCEHRIAFPYEYAFLHLTTEEGAEHKHEWHGRWQCVNPLYGSACLHATREEGAEHKHEWHGRWHCVDLLHKNACLYATGEEHKQSNSMADGTASVSYMEMIVYMQQERKSQTTSMNGRWHLR